MNHMAKKNSKTKNKCVKTSRFSFCATKVNKETKTEIVLEAERTTILCCGVWLLGLTCISHLLEVVLKG